jgi:hypothetical protein
LVAFHHKFSNVDLQYFNVFLVTCFIFNNVAEKGTSYIVTSGSLSSLSLCLNTDCTQHVLVSASNSTLSHFNKASRETVTGADSLFTWAPFISSIPWNLQWKDGYHQNSMDIMVLTKSYLESHSHYCYHPVLLCLHKLHFPCQIRCFIRDIFQKEILFNNF